MAQADLLQITLSEEELQFVHEQVSSGEFSSESELVSTALGRIRDEVDERRRWEREVLIPRLAQRDSQTEHGISVEQLLANLAERRLQRQNAR
jgi:Arc/MetJ-type ribon-helix-helix transcriptional regulator